MKWMFLTGNSSEIQKKLNQWQSTGYIIHIHAMTQNNNEITLLITRMENLNENTR